MIFFRRLLDMSITNARQVDLRDPILPLITTCLVEQSND